MKVLIVLFTVVCLALAAPRDSFEDINLDEYKSTAQLDKYTKCLVSNEGCTPSEAKLRAQSGQLIDTHCSDCSEKEKEILATLTARLSLKDPALFKDIFKAADPELSKSKAYLKALNEISAKGGFPQTPANALD